MLRGNFFMESVKWFMIHPVICFAKTQITNIRHKKVVSRIPHSMKKHEIFSMSHASLVVWQFYGNLPTYAWAKRLAPTHSMAIGHTNGVSEPISYGNFGSVENYVLPRTRVGRNQLSARKIHKWLDDSAETAENGGKIARHIDWLKQRRTFCRCCCCCAEQFSPREKCEFSLSSWACDVRVKSAEPFRLILLQLNMFPPNILLCWWWCRSLVYLHRCSLVQ